jgi:hypothetical protein
LRRRGAAGTVGRSLLPGLSWAPTPTQPVAQSSLGAAATEGTCGTGSGVAVTAADDEGGGSCDESSGGGGGWREGGCAAIAARLLSGAALWATDARRCRTRVLAETDGTLSLGATALLPLLPLLLLLLLRRPRRGRQDWCRPWLGSRCSSASAAFTCPSVPPTR